MSGQPWGRTGRVTLGPLYPGVLTEVYVDDELVGHVYDDDLYAWDCHRWKFSPLMPSLDHALWWLLRRAAPAVWRAERPVVWRVLRAWEQFPVLPWHVHGPDGSDLDSGYCVLGHADSVGTAESAIKLADRTARAEYARITS